MSGSLEHRYANDPLSFSSLLKQRVIDGEGKALGRLSDVVARLRSGDYPLLAGLVVGLDGADYFVPMGDVISIDREAIRLSTAKVDLRPVVRHDGELLLKKDVLGNRLIDVARSTLVRAYDIRLAFAAEGWIANGLDVHKSRWFNFGRHEAHPARDWHSFLLLIEQSGGAAARPGANGVTRLKPAQIADIIESASSREENILLAHVRQDPELEADVFEELDENKQARLLRARSDEEVATLLARMRADDAADAITDLARDRRRAVLELLPDPQRTKVLTLLGYHAATAGGLMGPEFLALPETRTIADAIAAVRVATTLQPEALTTIHTLRADGTLAGTITLVRALQMESATVLRVAADRNLVVAAPADDIIAVTTRMADFNLLSLPVVDDDQRMLGIVTVDDALEAAIPRDWTRRTSRG